MPTDKGANADTKAPSLVAGMAAGADYIDDMAILRHGGMRRVFDSPYPPYPPPSTLGSFLRAFTFGHVRQLAASTPLVAGIDDVALVDLEDTIIQATATPSRARPSATPTSVA